MDLYGWIAFMVESNILSSIASVATIITVIISAYKYFKEKNDEKTRASRNLYLELEDTLKSLDDANFPDDFYHTEIATRGRKKTVYFMNRSLNHDFYDSLIASGKINFLEPSLQQPVQAIFKRIKMHNEFLSTTRSMRDQQQEGPMQENVHTYYEWMDKSEVSLKREIPRMMKELEDHFKIQHRTAA